MIRSVAPLIFCLVLASCRDVQRGSSHGPIVLGDPRTIVTETDSAYLRSADADPALTDPSLPADAPTADTGAMPAPAAAPAIPAPAGYAVDFGDVVITLTGAAVQPTTKRFKGASSAALSAAGAPYSGTGLTVSGGAATKVEERKGLGVAAVRDGKPLLLGDLGTVNTAWNSLKNSGGAYAGAPLGAVSFPKVNAAAVRNAVDKAARSQKLSAKEAQAWQTAVRGQNSVSTSAASPLQAVVRSVTYRVEGKTAAGKAFSKEVRVDVPF